MHAKTLLTVALALNYMTACTSVRAERRSQAGRIMKPSTDRLNAR